jgi:hypothetical protein
VPGGAANILSVPAHGCLVIADIGGYTRYLSGVELEHSTDVLGDLLQTVVDAFEPNFRVAKVEGDAIFVYDGGEADGAVLVDALSGAYIAFMQRRRTVMQLTSCGCDACRTIGDLGLKIVAHRGDYAIHEIAGGTELVGRDVILVHRLLKNELAKRTGIRDYVVYTDPLTRELKLDPTVLGWQRESETYDDVGEIGIHVDDLSARWQSQSSAPRHLIPETEGATVVWELPAPPPVVWERLSHPDNVVRFMADSASQTTPGGARGRGTSTHCVHGSHSYDLEVLDWIPYELQSLRFRTRGLTFLYNSIYEETDAGRTRLTARIAPLAPRIAPILFPLVRRSIRKEYETWMRSLEQLLTSQDNGLHASERDVAAPTRAGA